MAALTIIADGVGAWPDLIEKRDKLIHLSDDAKAAISCLAEGMSSGKPSVALRLDLPDGRIVFYETSLALLLTAADLFRALYGDPRQESARASVQ